MSTSGPGSPAALLLWPNFVAEEELPAGSTTATKGAPLRFAAASRPALVALASSWRALFGGRAHVLCEEALGPASEAGEARAFPWLPEGPGLLPWLATEASAQLAAELGCPLLGPSPAVALRVHDKAFAVLGAALPAALDGLVTVLPPDLLADGAHAAAHIDACIARWPAWTRGAFTLKPRFGTSGRGRVPGVGVGAVQVKGALSRLAARGGAVLEPWLERLVDLSVQWHVDARGELEVLGTTRLRVTAAGVYLGNAGVIGEGGAVRSGTTYDAALIDGSRPLVAAAASEGFRGPCGVDAFVFVGPDGQPQLRPVVELNARFTSGTVALGTLRLAMHAGTIRPGQGWQFSLGAGQVLVTNEDGEHP